MRNLFDVLHIPPPGKLGSDAPGTGPDSGDTEVSNQPQTLGGPVIPRPGRGDATGYGGGGDSVQVALDPSLHAVRAAPPVPGLATPRFNALYDTLRTREAWKETVEASVTGSFTQATGNVVTAVTLASTVPIFRTSQYPLGVQVYPVIVSFSWAPVATTPTGAELFAFAPANGGPLVYLGGSSASGSGAVFPKLVLDSPMTDPGQLTLGNLVFTGNTIATPATVVFALSFGFVYLLPDLPGRGYVTDMAHVLGEPYEEALLRRNS